MAKKKSFQVLRHPLHSLHGKSPACTYGGYVYVCVSPSTRPRSPHAHAPVRSWSYAECPKNVQKTGVFKKIALFDPFLSLFQRSQKWHFLHVLG